MATMAEDNSKKKASKRLTKWLDEKHPGKAPLFWHADSEAVLSELMHSI